jgi:hypothetical protein
MLLKHLLLQKEETIEKIREMEVYTRKAMP